MNEIHDHRMRLISFGGVLVVLIIASALAVWFLRSNAFSPKVSTPTTAISPAVTAPKQATPDPGLVVYGRVIDETGAGVENVKIYRSYASYAGEVIATTDASGAYASVFYPIPGDENITVWAEKPGSTFAPEYCRWRHYYGFERAQCNFQINPQ